MAVPVAGWSVLPSGNSNLAGLPWNEGMQPSQVNDSARAVMAEIARANLPTVTAMKTLLKASLTDGQFAIVNGGAAVGDGDGGLYKWDAASTATANGASIVVTNEGGNGRWLRYFAFSTAEFVTPEQYGAVGDGVVDDDAALDAFLAAMENSGRIGVMTGRYKHSTQKTIKLNNYLLWGIKGYTKLIYAAGYVQLLIDEWNNGGISGIWFDNQTVNAAFFGRGSVCTSYGIDIVNGSFDDNEISAQNVNTRGFMVYAHTGSDAGSIDGLSFRRNRIHDIGDLGVTIMNRGGTPSDIRRLYIEDNEGKNLGLIGTDGFFFSLDGCGEDFTMSGNVGSNCKGIMYENVGFRSGTIKDNRGDTFSRTCSFFGMSIGTAGPRLTDLVVTGNQTTEPATATSVITSVDDSFFADNILEAVIGVGPAVQYDGCNNNTMRDRYVSVGNSPVLLIDTNGPCRGNQFDCIVDNSTGVGFSGIRFDGATTQYNVANLRATLSSTVADEVNGANLNLVTYTTPTNPAADQYLAFAMPDANASVAGTSAALIPSALLVINPAVPLTAGRQLTLLPHVFRRPRVVYNATTQTITLMGPGGAGSTIATGERRLIVYDVAAQLFYRLT